MKSPPILDAPTPTTPKPLRKAVQQHIFGSTLLIICFLMAIYNLEPSTWNGWGDTMVSLLFTITPLGLLFLGHQIIDRSMHKKVVAYIFLVPSMILIMVFSINIIETNFLLAYPLFSWSNHRLAMSLLLGFLNSAIYNLLILITFFLYAAIERYFLKH